MFERIYYWFESLYGEPLADHMAGFGPNSDGVYGFFYADKFNWCGMAALGSAILICALFYYAWDPAFGKRAKWFLALAAVAVINGVVGWLIPHSDHVDGLIDVGENRGVYAMDCVMMGVADAIVAVLFFVMVSFAIKWWSEGNKHIPFWNIKNS